MLADWPMHEYNEEERCLIKSKFYIYNFFKNSNSFI